MAKKELSAAIFVTLITSIFPLAGARMPQDVTNGSVKMSSYKANDLGSILGRVLKNLEQRLRMGHFGHSHISRLSTE